MATRLLSTRRASSCLRFSPTKRFPPLRSSNEGWRSRLRAASLSPSGRSGASILITSAPRATSTRVHSGPDHRCVRSTTRTPSRSWGKCRSGSSRDISSVPQPEITARAVDGHARTLHRVEPLNRTCRYCAAAFCRPVTSTESIRSHELVDFEDPHSATRAHPRVSSRRIPRSSPDAKWALGRIGESKKLRFPPVGRRVLVPSGLRRNSRQRRLAISTNPRRIYCEPA